MESISGLPVLARSFFSIKLLISVTGILSWAVKMRLQLIQQHYTIPCSLQLLAIFQSLNWNIQQSTLFNNMISQCTIYLGLSCSSWCSGSTLELWRNITFMSNLYFYNKDHNNTNFMGLKSHLSISMSAIIMAFKLFRFTWTQDGAHTGLQCRNGCKRE